MAIGKVTFSLLVLHLSCSLGAFSDIPEKCKRPPPGDVRPHECCKVPEIFPSKEMEECGFPKPEEFRKSAPTGPPECEKPICLLKKHSLMKNDDEIDLGAIGAFLDSWVETNPDYKDSVALAKQVCLKDPVPGLPHVCGPNNLVFCLGATMFSECPHWEETESCQNLKNHIDECKAYFRPA